MDDDTAGYVDVGWWSVGGVQRQTGNAIIATHDLRKTGTNPEEMMWWENGLPIVGTSQLTSFRRGFADGPIDRRWAELGFQ
jgi:hypothetical protein